MKTNILEYLEETADRLPEKVAFSNGSDDMTFRELSDISRRIGSGLLSRGFASEPVVILMAKHPREIAAFYGTVYAGCCYVPLDAEMPAKRMELILSGVGARVMIVDAAGEKIAASLRFEGTILSYEDLASSDVDEERLSDVRRRQIDTDPIYIVFTSGSTGVPKGVAAAHRSVIDYAEQLCTELHFSSDSVFANQTPLFFDAPLKEMLAVIRCGATAYLVPKYLFSFPTRLCDFLNQHKVNTVCWVVSALTMISSLGVLETNPPKYLRTVAFGSEVFPRRQYDLWRAALPEAEFYNLYGPTEATGMSCVWHAERQLEDGEPIPVGHPFRNTDLMLISEDGKRVANGETGEIYLRGTCVTLGYYNNPEKTREAFVQNPLQNAYPEPVYRTGDLGYRNRYGELVFVSRKDAQIKHMGHRIELGEIESVAADLDTVTSACCVYQKEKKQIRLFYTGKCAPEELTAHLRLSLPKYMLPSETVRMDRMPLTPNGKKDRKLLSDQVNAEK